MPAHPPREVRTVNRILNSMKKNLLAFLCSSILVEGLCEMLITELGKLNKFQVLETTELGALKDEIKMGDDGWVEQSEKVDKGGFAAADFMFTAKVTRFGNKETSVGLGGFVPGAL